MGSLEEQEDGTLRDVLKATNLFQHEVFILWHFFTSFSNGRRKPRINRSDRSYWSSCDRPERVNIYLFGPDPMCGSEHVI